jgi:hypothetical protein
VTLTERDTWDLLWSDLEALRSAVSRSQAVNVNAASLREQAQRVVQQYFRQVRGELVASGFTDPDLEAIDTGMQDLLQLSHGRNAKRSYVRVLGSLSRIRPPLAGLRERRLSEAGAPPAGGVSLSYGSVEQRILATLTEMLPDAASSYEQVVVDLATQTRLSWRGTAVEMREVVREVLDHLAPDNAVAQESGFRLERDRISPTMRQKATFVLRSRGLSSSSRRAPQDATAVVDELTAAFVRSTYERGSASAHGAPSREEVERLKMYVDTVLMELLETSGSTA